MTVEAGVLQEAVCSVNNLRATEDFYTAVAGWHVIHRGKADASQSNFWNLPEEPVDEVLLAAPNKDYGYLRLMKFHNVEQDYIRTGVNMWDTGGFYNLNIRVKDAQHKMLEMRERGWNPHSDVHFYDFEHMQMREVMLHGADNISITLVERVAPPLAGGDFREFSHVYNALQLVQDFEASRQFYVEQLGFKLIFDTPLSQDDPGDNLFGVPYNFAPEVKGRLGIFKPPLAEQSTLEIIQLEGTTGRSFAQNAVPPHRGIMLMRFLVDDLAAYHDRLKAQGTIIETAPRIVKIQPYGEVQVMVVKTPDGAWLEFMQR